MMGDVHGFKVVPDSVFRLGMLVERASADADVFVGHFNHDPYSNEGGCFDLIARPLAQLRHQGLTNTQKARDLAKSSANELFATYHWYRGKEQEALARLDAAYPEATSERQDEYGLPNAIGTYSFDDIADGADPHNTGRRYGGPGTPDFDAALRRDGWAIDWENKLDELGDRVSISGIARGLLVKICGHDPLEKVEKLISGDWLGIYVESVVFKDTAKAFEVIRNNVRRGRFAIQDDWEGNAAGAAENWLQSYAAACAEHTEFLEDAARKMERLAKAAYHRFRSLHTAVDTLIDMFADVAAMANLPNFAIMLAGAAKNGLSDFFKAIIALVNEITGLIDLVWALAHEFAGIFAAAAGQGQVVAAKWPCLAYDHPAAS